PIGGKGQIVLACLGQATSASRCACTKESEERGRGISRPRRTRRVNQLSRQQSPALLVSRGRVRAIQVRRTAAVVLPRHGQRYGSGVRSSRGRVGRIYACFLSSAPAPCRSWTENARLRLSLHHHRR